MADGESRERDIRVVMALKVRDEGDVLESNLRYHHALGVNHFVVTDNGSTDSTPDILRRYEEAGLAHVVTEPGTDYRVRGAAWLTDMARLAATELGADWVIHTDADEFWLPAEGSLNATLAAIPDRYGVVMGPRAEFVGRPDGPGSFAERLTVREARSRLQPKVAHRAEPDVVSLDRGPHDVTVEGPTGDIADTLRPPGRAVHRSVRDPDSGEAPTASQEDEGRLAWAPMWPIRILHFPVRSFAQLKRRTEVAIFEGHYPNWGRFKRLRELYEQGRFDELFADLVLDDAEIEEGIRDGSLVRDERFARVLARCPDPLDGGPPGTVSVDATPEEVARERDELEFDAMQLLGRTSRWTTVQRDRNRERIESLQTDVNRTTRQRDAARRKLERRRKRVQSKKETIERQERRIRKLRRNLKAERARPWAKTRRRAKALRRRVGRLLGR